MSSSLDSSSSSGRKAEESFYDEIVEFSGIVPYDEDLEQDLLRRLNLLRDMMFKLVLL